MHRSGTTWLGAACAKANDTIVLHEPFNYNSGVRGIPHWYPDPTNNNSPDQLYKVVSRVISGRANFRLVRSNDSFFKAIGRLVTLGGPDFWRYRRQINRDVRHLILKDPFGIRMGLWLSEHFDFNTLILIRHPHSLYLSLSRMHWQTPEVKDNGIFSRKKGEICYDAAQRAREFGEFWRHIYENAVEQSKASNGAVKVLRHEDLCMQPIEVATDALQHLGLRMNESVSDFLLDSSSGDIVAPPEKVLHSMKRNSGELVNAWRQKLSVAEQDAIMRASGPTLVEFYGDSDLPLSL